MQFQLKADQLSTQIQKHKHNSQTYRIRLQVMNNARAQISLQLDSLSKDYQKKIKNLQTKVLKLQAQNKQLSKKNCVYKAQIQQFKLRLLQKQKLISSMLSQKFPSFLKNSESSQLVNVKNYQSVYKQEKEKSKEQDIIQKDNKQKNNPDKIKKRSNIKNNQQQISNQSLQQKKVELKKMNEILHHQELKIVNEKKEIFQHQRKEIIENQSFQKVKDESGWSQNRKTKKPQKQILSMKKDNNLNKSSEKHNNFIQTNENHHILYQNEEIDNFLYEKKIQNQPQKQQKKELFNFQNAPEVAVESNQLFDQNLNKKSIKNHNIQESHQKSYQYKEQPNQQKNQPSQLKNQSVQIKRSIPPPPPIKKKDQKKITKHKKNITKRFNDLHNHQQSNVFEWQNLKQRINLQQNTRQNGIKQGNIEFDKKEEQNLPQNQKNRNFFDHFQNQNLKSQQFAFQNISQIKTGQQNYHQEIVLNEQNYDFQRNQFDENKIDKADLFFNNLSNQYKNNYEQQSSIQHVDHIDTSTLSNQNMVNMLNQYNQQNQIPSKKKMNKKKAKRQNITVLDPNSFV